MKWLKEEDTQAWPPWDAEAHLEVLQMEAKAVPMGWDGI